MKIKHALFDASGVVINASMFSVEYEKQFGVSNDAMRPFFKDHFGDCLVGKLDLKEALEPFLKDWKWPGTVEEFLQFWFEAENSVDKRIVEKIKELQKEGVRCHLATNQEKYRTSYIKKEMGLGDIFDQMFLSSEVGFKKPEQGFYEKAFDQIGAGGDISKEELLLIDDSRENVDKAIEFGMRGYFYQNFDNFIKDTKLLLQGT